MSNQRLLLVLITTGGKYYHLHRHPAKFKLAGEVVVQLTRYVQASKNKFTAARRLSEILLRFVYKKLGSGPADPPTRTNFPTTQAPE
jgi:hypothetical protein